MDKNTFLQHHDFCKRNAYVEFAHSCALSRGDFTLENVYETTYSYAKQKAYEYCKNLFNSLEGHGFAIISHNTFIFTAGFYFYLTDEETGEITHECFTQITPNYDRFWVVKDYTEGDAENA